MKQRLSKFVALSILLLVGWSTAIAEEDGSYVKLPLDQYSTIVEQARDPKKEPRVVPGTFAIGKASISVDVLEAPVQGRSTSTQKPLTAHVRVELAIRILEDEWTAVPILPAGTPVNLVAVGDVTEPLMSTPAGLVWTTNKSGLHLLRVEYKVDVVRSAGANSLQVPLTQASATTLDLKLPAVAKNISLIPASGIRTEAAGDSVRVRATIPASSGVQVSWNDTVESGFSMSRATYFGAAGEDSVTWTAQLELDVLGDSVVTVPLLPDFVTLRDIRVDQQPANIFLVDIGYGINQFATKIEGRGSHIITFEVESAIDKKSGPAKTTLSIPLVPVSKVSLQLEGKKEVSVVPASAVSKDEQGDKTVSTVFVPMSTEVTLTWTEAVPEDVQAEARTNATIYHVAFAEENVLSATARLELEVTRGETNVIQLDVPKGVQINQVVAPGGGIADWRMESVANSEDLLTIYLDRQLQGVMVIELNYDTSIVGKSHEDSFQVPLLRMRKVHRQRGMVALLASKELTFKAVEEKELSRVGENQLPPEIRQAIDKTVALSYKYAEAEPTLLVQLAKPEKLDGKFDVGINTLVSLSDVTLKGSASVDVHVKSGTISVLELEIPAQVNVLSLSAPSLRTHRVTAENESTQLITVEFTQEMEGDFRLDVSYERILGDAEQAAIVPTLLVRKAEVEQGRIAVEALSAVEVLPEVAEQLSVVDPSELPQQLVLKTTNPILLAYKYAHVSPPYRLSLKVRRHKQIEVQAAAIDEAIYRTLYTRDGIAVTSARFSVRNSREQFLRVKLPAGATIWHAAVDGKPEKPALAEDGASNAKSNQQTVLIKIINSAQAFSVDVVYQEPISQLGRLGVVTGSLPEPELIVTRTNWEVFLPSELSYGRVRTNMTTVSERIVMNREAIEQRLAGFGDKLQAPIVQPPQMTVPLEGVYFGFTKLYANQGAEDAYFAVPYASGFGAAFGQGLALFGVLLVLGGAVRALKRSRQALALIGFGIILLGLLLGYYGIDYRPALGIAVVALVAALGQRGLQLLAARRAPAASDGSSESIGEQVVDGGPSGSEFE